MHPFSKFIFKLIPYLHFEFESSKSMEQLKELLNGYLGMSEQVPSGYNAFFGLKLSARGNNKFHIASKEHKTLVANGSLTEEEEVARVSMTIRLNDLTLMFIFIVLTVLIPGIIFSDKPLIPALIILLSYGLNVYLFQRRAQDLKDRLHRILR